MSARGRGRRQRHARGSGRKPRMATDAREQQHPTIVAPLIEGATCSTMPPVDAIATKPVSMSDRGNHDDRSQSRFIRLMEDKAADDP